MLRSPGWSIVYERDTELISDIATICLCELILFRSTQPIYKLCSSIQTDMDTSETAITHLQEIISSLVNGFSQ